MTDSTIDRTVLGLLPSTDYVVRVRSYNNLGVSSDWSEALVVTTETAEIEGDVLSVFNRIGEVAAQTGDYTAAQVTNAADKASSSTQTFSGPIISQRLTANKLTSSGYIGLSSGSPGNGTYVAKDWAIDLSTPGIWITPAGGTNPTDWTNLLGYIGNSVSHTFQGSAVVDITGTTFTDLGAFTHSAGSTNYDITLPARIGDTIQLNMSFLWDAGTLTSGLMDIVTVVAGSFVNYMSTSTTTPATWGIASGMSTTGGDITSCSIALIYTVASDDLAGGQITFRPITKTISGAQAVLDSFNSSVLFSAINQG